VFLSTLGTAAMLWVGGSMVVHGLEVFGFDALGHAFEAWSEAAAHAVPAAAGLVAWAVKAALDGVVGLALGLVLIPVATRVIEPVWGMVTGKKSH
jgi:predicted DNA repair protein MutK